MRQLAQDREYRLHAELAPGCGCSGRTYVSQRVNRQLLLVACDECRSEYGVRPRELDEFQRTREFATNRWWDR